MTFLNFYIPTPLNLLKLHEFFKFIKIYDFCIHHTLTHHTTISHVFSAISTSLFQWNRKQPNIPPRLDFFLNNTAKHHDQQTAKGINPGVRIQKERIYFSIISLICKILICILVNQQDIVENPVFCQKHYRK